LNIFFPPTEFFSNQTVKGFAELKIPEPLEINGVEYSVTGNEEGELKGTKELNTFFKVEDLCVGKGSQNKEKDWLGRKKTITTKLPEGKYFYPFEFNLPELLPGCFETKEARVFYEIKVEVISGNKKMQNLVATASIPVGGSLYDLNYIGNHTKQVELKESKTFLLTSGSLDINFTMPSEIYLAGTQIDIKLNFDNKTKKIPTKCKLSLFQNVLFYINGSKRGKALQEIVKIDIGTINAKENKKINEKMVLPDHLCETIQKSKIPVNKKEVKVGKIIRVDYFLQFHGEVQYANDITFEVPIIIVRRCAKKEEVKKEEVKKEEVKEVKIEEVKKEIIVEKKS